MPRPLPPAVRHHLTGLRMLLVLTVLAGIAYPLLVTGVSQLAFTPQANGSILRMSGREIGSSLLGQRFDLPKHDPGDPSEQPQPDPRWFQPRPSAVGYDPTDSGGTNLGPDSSTLLRSVRERRAFLARFDGVDPASVPADALTSSGSGLDPEISVAYAREQVDRVARARDRSPAELSALVDRYTKGRSLGFLGAPGVNVLELNRALAESG